MGALLLPAPSPSALQAKGERWCGVEWARGGPPAACAQPKCAAGQGRAL